MSEIHVHVVPRLLRNVFVPPPRVKKDYELVGHPAVQRVISMAWMGQLQTQTSTFIVSS